jgi:CheY-like chemotaxis protein
MTRDDRELVLSGAAPSPAPRFSILVIDDDEVVLSTLTDLLRAHGYLVRKATNGRAGFEAARVQRPDLILVDYHMPEMNGLAVVEALKGDAATRAVPVVAFTSGTAAEANRLVRAGCIGFIPKPFDPGSLPGLVAEFLRATIARERRVARPSVRPTPAS